MSGQPHYPSSPNMYPVHGGPPQQGYQGYPQQQPYQQHGGSQPTLPRYASNGSNVSSGLSPLNPSAHQQYPQQRAGSAMSSNNGLNSRYSTYGYANGGPGAQGGAHPLSNALYADSPSSPTLAGNDDEMDEKKGLASFPPSSSSSSGDSGSRQNVAGPHSTKPAGGAYRRWSGAHIGDDQRDERHTKPERIGWLDGLRFFAAWGVLNATFFDATIRDANQYSAIQRSSPAYIFRSFSLGLTFFLIILGRAVTAPLWDISSGNVNPNNLAKYGVNASPTISFPRLTRAMLTRTFRFILPVLVVAGLQWALGATNATKDANAAGMEQPYWNLISSFAGYVTVVFNCFTAFEWDQVAGKAFAGNLWSNAWLFQSSFAAYICHMMLGNLSSARYWIYGALVFLMWCTNNYFALALIGVILSDMAAHGQFAKVKRWPFARALILQLVLLAVALVLQFINPVRNGLNNGMSTISVLGHGQDLQFADLIFGTCVMLVFETSSILQAIFGNIVMRLLGKLAPGMYLLAPAIVFTVVPSLGVSLSNNGTSGSGVLGVTWVVTFAICVVAAIPFHFLVELPSKYAGEAFADFTEKWGATPDDGVQVKGPQKSAPKKLSGPGGK